ncbi:hypothetical protein FB45DRAFT_939076 [Roridomyces roridus]|uniref:Uncharacterized protein n=1 Tax=Roridomyces roridus TaxID=1738132 RepID=A0AAD7B8F4_9AGAR|nr:hypothetical protein FB45DRAFT_939076 [Roridomyces roridus]
MEPLQRVVGAIIDSMLRINELAQHSCSDTKAWIDFSSYVQTNVKAVTGRFLAEGIPTDDVPLGVIRLASTLMEVVHEMEQIPSKSGIIRLRGNSTAGSKVVGGMKQRISEAILRLETPQRQEIHSPTRSASVEISSAAVINIYGGPGGPGGKGNRKGGTGGAGGAPVINVSTMNHQVIHTLGTVVQQEMRMIASKITMFDLPSDVQGRA